jgi:hypothetical protein
MPSFIVQPTRHVLPGCGCLGYKRIHDLPSRRHDLTGILDPVCLLHLRGRHDIRAVDDDRRGASHLVGVDDLAQAFEPGLDAKRIPRIGKRRVVETILTGPRDDVGVLHQPLALDMHGIEHTPVIGLELAHRLERQEQACFRIGRALERQRNAAQRDSVALLLDPIPQRRLEGIAGAAVIREEFDDFDLLALGLGWLRRSQCREEKYACTIWALISTVLIERAIFSRRSKA